VFFDVDNVREEKIQEYNKNYLKIFGESKNDEGFL